MGENVFTQVAGVHADGDNKRNLYCNDLLPERFGRRREYALGKNSGKANIRKNLQDLGLELDEESMRKVTERIIELGDKKELVTQEDLPYIVSDVLKHDVQGDRVRLLSYIVNLAHGLKPMATLRVEINGTPYEESSSGDGQYDAFVRALRKVYKGTLGRRFPMLTNYAVSIPAEPHRAGLRQGLTVFPEKHRRLSGETSPCFWKKTAMLPEKDGQAPIKNRGGGRNYPRGWPELPEGVAGTARGGGRNYPRG